MKNFIFAILFVISFGVNAEQPYSPYNQQFTYNQNQQFGSTNWYSSALGMGVAQAGVLLVGGLVNAMSRPDPVVVQQQQQPQYVNGGYPQQGNGYPQQGYGYQSYPNQYNQYPR